MDALTLAISNSFINNKISFILKMAITFGLFQSIMCYLGSFLGIYVTFFINPYHYIFSFFVFTIIGINMLKSDNSFLHIDNYINLLFLGFITSIDAFSIGITLSFYKDEIIFYSLIIGIITFILCFFGSLFSKIIADYFPKYANRIGGILLILEGLYFLVSYF